MLIAGAKFRGEFEERRRRCSGLASKNQIILFIDELHTMVGARRGRGCDGCRQHVSLALARGELHCIGATTLDEYRKYVERMRRWSGGFSEGAGQRAERRDSIAILRGLKERYEVHHGVDITDPAIVAAATLSHRYITDRNLPDKAIDLVDGAASRIRMEIDSKPEK